MSVSYIPLSDALRVVWLNKLSNRLGQYATALGFTTNEVTIVQHDAAMFSYSVQLLDSAHQYWTAVSGVKKLLRSSPQQLASTVFPAFPSVGTPPASVNSGIFNRIVLLVA